MPETDFETAVPPDGAPPGKRVVDLAGLARLGTGVLLVFWFFLVAAHLWRTDSALWSQGNRAPLGVFSYLVGPYSISWACTPLIPLAAGLVALVVYAVMGWMFLRSTDVYFTRVEEAALSLLLGAGFCGLLFEFLGMAHMLGRLPILILVGAVAGGLGMWMRLHQTQPLETWSWKARTRLAQRLAEYESEDDGVTSPFSRYEQVELGREGKIRLESAVYLYTGPPERRAQLRSLWRKSYQNSLFPSPDQIPGEIVWIVLFLVVLVITALTFYHALLYPETYWDSLILYLGYGRMTFLEEGFPFKACAQVGIGLGANYPHLFSTHAAAVSAVLGSWSDVPARLYAPVAALAATVLIYSTALRIWRNRLAAICCALAFRALPYTIAYSQYASDYALVLWFGAAFVFLAVCYVDTPLPGTVVLLTLIPALAMHVNYLMAVLWVVWAVVLGIAHWPRPASTLDAVVSGERELKRRKMGSEEEEEEEEDVPVGDPYFAQAWGVPGILGLLGRARLWSVLIPALLLAVTWNVRNWWLTGNPVYAFFPKTCDGVRINEDVLRSAEREWFLNGDGIGRLAETLPSMSTLTLGEDTLTSLTVAGDHLTSAPILIAAGPQVPPPRTLRDRLKASWMYWVGFETFHYPGTGTTLQRGRLIDRLSHLLLDWKTPDENRPLQFAGIWVEGKDTATPHVRTREAEPLPGTAVVHWRHVYKLAPTTIGLAVPGLLLWGGGLMGGGWARWRLRGKTPGLRTFDPEGRAGLVLATFGFVFLAYHYVVADFYLYQILSVVVVIALFAGWLPAKLLLWAETGRWRYDFYAVFGVLSVLVVLTGLVPGVAMGLMGFKFTGQREFEGEQFSQFDLAVLHHPGMAPEAFWRLQYGPDAEAWEYLNHHLSGERLLTHENRHYVLEPSITLVHLDDWDVQKTYTMTNDREKMGLFRTLGLRYYYYVPNEDRHAINRRVGLDAWRNTPYMTELKRWGENVLYRLNWAAAGLPQGAPATFGPLESYEPLRRLGGETP